MVIVVENLKAGKENHSGSENEGCIYLKQSFILHVEFGKHIKEILIFLEKWKVTLKKIRSCISRYFSKAAFLTQSYLK